MLRFLFECALGTVCFLFGAWMNQAKNADERAQRRTEEKLNEESDIKTL